MTLTGCGKEASQGAAASKAEKGSPQGTSKGGGGKGPKGPVGVVVEAASAESFPYEIEALGTAYANEAVTIMAKVSNLVTAIHFREGQNVQKGQLLLELDSVEAGAELAGARAALTETQSQYKRSQELFATKALSQSSIDQIEATLRTNEARVTAAQAKVRDTMIRAPFAGRVGLRRVSIGSLIAPATEITTLDDTSTIKLDFSVPENFMSVVREGLQVTARSVAYAGQEFSGTVASVDSRVDPVTRSVLVRAKIPNGKGLLKPGMFLTVRLQQPRDNVVVISEQALVPEGDHQYVFVIADEKAQKRAVDIGRRKPGRVEIVSGLNPGEQIVIEGTQLLRDGAAVRASMKPTHADLPQNQPKPAASTGTRIPSTQVYKQESAVHVS